MKHTMSAMAGLLADKKYDELRELVQQATDDLNSITPKVYNRSGVLNALLSEKVTQAEKRDIPIKVEVEPDVDISFLKEMDMIHMFGNLIDNALRAAEKCEGSQREVWIRLFKPEGNFIIFQTENYYKEKPKYKNGELLTTKRDKVHHGIGITSTKKMAEHYGGLLDISFDGNKALISLSLSTLQL